MKYKIEITTFANGRKEYRAYVKRMFGWRGLYSDGEVGYASKRENRIDCLHIIDLHYAGNHKKTQIEIEYITKK